MISRCCNADVYIVGNEVYYYACRKCNGACYLKEKKMSDLKWEPILEHDYNETTRLKVYGGWIVRVKTDSKIPNVGMIFIPDEKHEWSLNE